MTRPSEDFDGVEQGLHPEEKEKKVEFPVKTWKVNWLDGNSCLVKIWNKLFG